MTVPLLHSYDPYLINYGLIIIAKICFSVFALVLLAVSYPYSAVLVDGDTATMVAILALTL